MTVHAKTFWKSAKILFRDKSVFRIVYFLSPYTANFVWIAHFVAEKRLFLYLFAILILWYGDFYFGSTLTAIFPCTHPYTNRAAVGTYVYNSRYSHTSGRKERAPSRTNWINKDSQKGAILQVRL